MSAHKLQLSKKTKITLKIGDLVKKPYIIHVLQIYVLSIKNAINLAILQKITLNNHKIDSLNNHLLIYYIYI